MISNTLFTITGIVFLLGLIFFAGGWLICILLPRTNSSDIEKSLSEYLAIAGFCIMLIAICFGSTAGIAVVIEAFWSL